MSWQKSDGAKIEIRFSEQILPLDAGNESAFVVTVPEYTYVPNGTIQQNVKAVKSVENKPDDSYAVVLIMEDTQRFCNVAGDITVEYTGSGTLTGQGGPVEAFAETFTPTDLVYKGHQNDAEYIAISTITPSVTLTKIDYISTVMQEQGRVSLLSITPTAALTHVDDV